MRNCENCGSLIPDDARSCYYCGQKVNMKTHSPTDNKQVPRQNVSAKSLPGTENDSPGSTFARDEMAQPPTADRDAEEGKNQPLSPTPPTNPAGSTRSPNPVLLAVLLIAVISALVLGGVIAVYAVRHPPSAVTPVVTPSPQITLKPGSQVTPTVSPQAKPTTPTSSGGNPVPITVNVSPNGFSQTSCPQNNDASWTCIATVTETAGSHSVNWSVTSSFSDVTFTPLNGSVSIGNPNKVSITIPANDCQNSTFTFNFTGGVNSSAKSWNCIPGGGGVNGCSFSYTAGQGWTCAATVFSNADNLSNVPWSTNSTGVSGITFTPQNGVLPPNQTAQVTISIPDTICPTSASLNFSIGKSNGSFPWSCPTPNLTVSPTSLGVKDCKSLGNGNRQCTVTLSDNQGGAKWIASSDINGVTFTPASDTVYPSGETVTITVDCTNRTFTFTGSGNSVTVSWAGCIA